MQRRHHRRRRQRTRTRGASVSAAVAAAAAAAATRAAAAGCAQRARWRWQDGHALGGGASQPCRQEGGWPRRRHHRRRSQWHPTHRGWPRPRWGTGRWGCLQPTRCGLRVTWSEWGDDGGGGRRCTNEASVQRGCRRAGKGPECSQRESPPLSSLHDHGGGNCRDAGGLSLTAPPWSTRSVSGPCSEAGASAQRRLTTRAQPLGRQGKRMVRLGVGWSTSGQFYRADGGCVTAVAGA